MNNGVIFTIDKSMFEKPLESGDVRIYQVGENIVESGGEIVSHTQRCCEISYVSSGEAFFYADGKYRKLVKGDIQIISRRIEHRIVPCASSRLRYMFLGFDIISDSGIGAVIKDFYDNADVIYIKDNGTAYSIFNSFVNELSFDADYSRELYLDYARILLINIFRIYADIRSKSFETNRQMLGSTVFAIMKYIDANIMTVNRISDIAKNLNYSSAYLSRLFKQKMGINIKEYLDEKKIDKAKQLLGENKYKINEISSMLGFENYANFCKKFHRITGYSPSEYRK